MDAGSLREHAVLIVRTSANCHRAMICMRKRLPSLGPAVGVALELTQAVLEG